MSNTIARRTGLLIKRLNAGIQVCDLGCAGGVALLLKAKAFPRGRFLGSDISKGAIDVGRDVKKFRISI